MVDIFFIGRLFLCWNKNTLILNTWSIYDNSTTFALEDKFSSALKRKVILLLMIEWKEWTIDALKIIKVHFHWENYTIFICF